jgi:putative heme-binding domain-containing protein
MLKRKAMRGRRIAQSILLALVPVAVAMGLGQTQSLGPSESKSPGASVIAGDPVTGKAIFDGAGNCLSCHRVGATGSVLGPNLSNVGAQLSPDELKQKLLNPSSTIDPKDLLYEIVTVDGKTVKGKLLNQGPFSLQMLDSEGRLVAIPRSQIRAGHFVQPLQMPSFQAKFTSAQVDDLVAYLASLRVPGNE